MPGVQIKRYENEKRNMAALTPQLEIKCLLKQRQFARVAYTNSFEAGILAKNKMPDTEENSSAVEAIE